MRHRVKGKKLNRTASHRLATMRSLATALFLHKKIKTTVAKAKYARLFVEPLITKAKNGSVHAHRLVARHIHDREAMKELFGTIAEKVAERPGGYTRVVKLGQRPGDGAEMAILELVDFGETGSNRTKKKSKTEKVAAEKPEVKEENIEEAEIVEETVTEENTDEEQKAETEAAAVEETEVVEAAETNTEKAEEKTEKKSDETKADESSTEDEEKK